VRLEHQEHREIRERRDLRERRERRALRERKERRERREIKERREHREIRERRERLLLKHHEGNKFFACDIFQKRGGLILGPLLFFFPLNDFNRK